MMKTIRDYRVLAAVLMVATGALAFGPMQAQALDLGDIIKVGGIGFLVTQFGGQLDDFINSLTGNKNLSPDQDTKVVPIISLGSGGHIGAAQVTGRKVDIDKVKAVGQLEANFSGRTFRVKALVPINKIAVTDISRVKGVGVSAVIDVRI